MNHAVRWLAGWVAAGMFLGMPWPAWGQATSRAATQPSSRPSSRAVAPVFNRGQMRGGYEISATSDRPDGQYESGQTIPFRVTVTRNGQPVTEGSVVYQFTVNEVVKGESGTAALGEKGATVQATLKEPSCVVLRAEYRVEGGESIWVESGAAADANRIAPSMPAPDDFDAFWAAQKRRLAEVPAKATLTPVEANGLPTSVEIFDVQVDCAGGKPMSAYYVRPKGAKPKSLPIILTVQGAGVSKNRPAGAAYQAAGGRLVMSLNAHGIPNDRPAKYYEDLWKGELADYFLRGWESRESCYFLGMFLRLRRAMDFLCSQPEWDGKNLMVMGSSQGGAQAVAAAGLDERVNVLSADIPAMCDLTAMQVNRSAGWPFQRKALDANQVNTARYFDMCNFAARTRATAVVSLGLIDHTCPPAGTLAMFNQLKGTKYLFTGPNTGHGYTYGPRPPGSGAILKELMAEALKK